MKACSKCKAEQPLNCFGKDKSRKDGKQPWCKSCQKAYRAANKEKLSATNQRWKKANPDRVKASRDKRRARPDVKQQRAEYNKKWKRDNPDKVRKQRQKAYNANPEKARETSRKWAAANPEKTQKMRKAYREKPANKEKRRAYRKKNRHKDLAYYQKNKERCRLRKEANRKWVVYKIVFSDGCFYLGASCQHKLRFNAHRSKASKGRHMEALNGRDFSTAKLEVVSEHESEIETLRAEKQAVEESLSNPHCLNTMVFSLPGKLFWVYVIQSLKVRTGKKGQTLPGFFYVGMTTDPSRRLREHNGLYANGKPGNPNGGKYTRKHRPFEARALYGPYFTRSEALRAEYALKRKRAKGRLCWTPEEHPLCRGEGVQHLWVNDQSWKPPTPEEWESKQRTGSVEDPT